MTMPMRDVTPIPKQGPKVKKARRKRATPDDARYWKSRADELWGELIHLRDREQCQFCGKVGGKKDAHHIVLRTKLRTRWEPDNGILLCWPKCHQDIAHGDATLAKLHYERLRGDRYEELRQLGEQPARFKIQDLRDICARLEAEVARVR